MFWFVILVIAGFAVYWIATHGARSGGMNQPAPSIPGNLWAGSMASGIPVARFGDGNIWEGSLGVGLPVGRYADGNIWAGSGAVGFPIGRYADGSIWDGSGAVGYPIARYADGSIWEGTATAGLPVARYDGEGDGAAAAAFLFKLVKRPGGLEMPVG